jgi:hypothetical protein
MYCLPLLYHTREVPGSNVNYFNTKADYTQVHIYSHNCSFKQAYLKISRVIRDNTNCDKRSGYSTTLLHLHGTWSKEVEDEHWSLLGWFVMWAGKLLQTFRPNYAPWRTFSVMYEWSIYSDRQRKHTYSELRQPVTFPKCEANRLQYKSRPCSPHQTARWWWYTIST